MGPEHNRLHEGLVRCQLVVRDNDLVEQEISRPEDATPFTGDIANVQKLVHPQLGTVTEKLATTADAQANKLIDTLKERGELARKHAQSLATERITAIRNAIKEWQKRSADLQMQFAFDDEEQEQREHDLLALQLRLEHLQQERETEPKRQRNLYKVTDQRMYPVALEVILPKEGN